MGVYPVNRVVITGRWSRVQQEERWGDRSARYADRVRGAEGGACAGAAVRGSSGGREAHKGGAPQGDRKSVV